MFNKFFRKREDHFDYSIPRTCQNCKNLFEGKYCPRCSEKVFEPADRTIQGFVSNVFNAFTFIDGKFVQSFKYILLKPGHISADIAQGIREPYMKPVAFFFVANFIYFLFPVFQTFNTNLFNQISSMPYSNFARQVVNDYLLNHHTDLNAFAPLYNSSSTNWSKLLLILISLLLLPFMILMNYNKNKKNYLADHLLFSVEYASYILFVPTILLGFTVNAIILVGGIFSLDWSIISTDQYSIFGVGVLLLYFQLIGTYNFYKLPIWRIILNAALMVFVFYLVIHLYRFILFIITMWTSG